MGYVPQGLALFPHLTVRGNVAYPLALRGGADAAARTDRLLSDWGLRPLARAPALSVSGGEQQRTAMARALAADPRVLLWDEPLAAVDARARTALIEAVRTVLAGKGLSMLLVTHDAETAFSVADRILLLEGGRAVARTTPGELVDRPPTRFAAEFVGYDNVLSRETLLGHAGTPLAAWLVERAGPEGVGFPATALCPARGAEGWPARVVRRRRMPGGRQLWLDAGGLPLRLLETGPAPPEPEDRPPALLRVDLDASQVRPLGRTEAG